MNKTLRPRAIGGKQRPPPSSVKIFAAQQNQQRAATMDSSVSKLNLVLLN